MSRHWFETGTLTAEAPLPTAPTAIVEGNVGTPNVIVSNPVANLLDGDAGTTYRFSVNDGTNYGFVRIDLGSPKAVSSVALDGIVSTGPTQMRCYVSNTASTTNPATGTALAAAQTASGRAVWISASPVTGRYIYISPSGIPGSGGPWTPLAADVSIWTVGTIPFATLNRIGVQAGFESSPLQAPSTESMFPIDLAFHSGRIEMSAEYVNIEPDALLKVLNCDKSGTSFTTLTPIKSGTSLPPLSIFLEGLTTAGKRCRFKATRCFAPGAQIDFSLGQFATQAVNFATYLDSEDLAAYWEFED
jgi:hypothetical protein